MHNDIVRLQRELMEAQGFERIRPYTASARCRRDIELLSNEGYSTAQISYILGMQPSIVKSRLARSEEREAQRRSFLATGEIPEQTAATEGAYVAIIPK